MSMHRKFASIAHSTEHGYSFDSDAWEYNASPFLSCKFRMYQTFGDGDCQHSNDFPVTEDFAIDYLNSLAAAMLEDEALAEQVGYMHRETRSDLLQFAASLIYNPEKDSGFGRARYFSVLLGKISRNQDKQHDDRFKELTDLHTGSAESIYKILIPGYSDGYERWQLADIVRNWVAEHLKNGFMELPAVFLSWFGQDSSKARAFRDAHEACEGIAKSYRDRKNAIAQIECYRGELGRKAQRECLQLTAEAATEAA